MPWAAAAAVAGAVITADAQSDSAQTIADASGQLSTTLGDFGGTTFGGISSNFNQTTNQSDIGVGDLDVSADMLTRLISGSLQPAGNQFAGAADTTGRLSSLVASQGAPDFSRLAGLEQSIAGVREGAIRDIRSTQGGVQNLLQDQAFSGAQQSLGDIGGADAARLRTLSNLRSQALPGQERAVDRTLTNLFSRGRLGTTGGANVIGRLAEAQNQQDLGFQLAANQEGRNTQNNALGLAQGQANIGQSLLGQQDSLLNSAFNRFGQTTNLAADLDNTRFDRNVRSTGVQSGLLQQLFGQQAQLPGLQQGFQQGNLNTALSGIQGIANIQNIGLNNFQASLAAAQAAANARIGAGSNVAAAISNPNFGANNVQAGLGTALVQNAGNVGGFLEGVFSPAQTPTRFAPIDQNAQNTRGL